MWNGCIYSAWRAVLIIGDGEWAGVNMKVEKKFKKVGIVFKNHVVKKNNNIARKGDYVYREIWRNRN